MNMTAEVEYGEVAEQKLEDLRDEVGPVKTGLKSMKVVTG